MRNKTNFELKVGEVFTKEKSDKLMKYLRWFIKQEVSAKLKDLKKKVEGIDRYAMSNFSGIHKNKEGLFIKIDEVIKLLEE